MKIQCIECYKSHQILHWIQSNKSSELTDDFKLYEVHFVCVCGNRITVDKRSKLHYGEVFSVLGGDELKSHESADFIHDYNIVENLYNHGTYPYRWGITSDLIAAEFY